jgi:phosphatidate phosphatase APP1
MMIRLPFLPPFRLGGGARVAASAVAMLLVFAGCLGPLAPACGAKDAPAAGQKIVFFPSPASLSGDGKSCVLTVQGRIFKPIASSEGRNLLINAVAVAAGLNGNETASSLFHERAGDFLSDSEGGEHASIKIGDQTFPLPASDKAGYFTAQIPLAQDAIKLANKDGVISFQSFPTAANPEIFSGQAVLVPEEGIFVVTDMDDTIKDTHVLDKKEMLRNTFVRPFAPVTGMPSLYRHWKDTLGDSIQFQVVSAGPWQLNQPLREFTEQAGFPPFTWQMRDVDIKATNLSELTAKPYCFKVGAIETLMKHFPKRHFVFVGDSGEQDPEVYSTILLEFPDRVDAVFIRELSDQRPPADAPVCEGVDAAFIRQVPKGSSDDIRYRILFADAAATKFRAFRDPKDLPALDTLIHAHGGGAVGRTD